MPDNRAHLALRAQLATLIIGETPVEIWQRSGEPFTASAAHVEELGDEVRLQYELVALEKQALELRREAALLRPSRWLRVLRWIGRLFGAREQ